MIQELLAKWGNWKALADALAPVGARLRPWVTWRVLRWALLVPVVLIAILILLPFLIPVSVYKEQIIAQARSATGRELKIDGDLRLSFWPSFGVRVEKVSFANAAGAVEPQMATMDTMIIGAELLPLLSGSLRVTEVRFVKPVINLEIDKAGRGNWLFDTGTAAAAAPADKTAAGGEISFADARIDDGVLTYRDARSGTVQRIDAIDVVVRLPSLDEPMTIDGGLTWNKEAIDIDASIADPRSLSSGGRSDLKFKAGGDVMTAAFDGTFDAAGNVAAGTVDFGTSSVKRLAAWVGASAGDADRFGAIKVSGSVTVRPDVIALKDAKFSAGGELVQATFTGTVDTTNNRIAGVVEGRTASVRELAKLAGAALPGSNGFGPATVSGPFSFVAGRLAFNKAKFSVDGKGFEATFTGALNTATGGLAGTIDARSDSARQLAGRVGAALPGTRGFGPMTLSGTISTSTGRVAFKDARLAVDGDVLRTGFTGILETSTGKISGIVDLRSSSARELAARTGFALPGVRGLGPLTVTGALSATPGRIAFNDARLTVDGDVLNANFTGVFETAGAKVAGKVALRSSSARQLAARAGIELPEGQGFGALAISGALNSTPQRIAFDNARISLDGMNGSGDLTLTTGARTYAKANLALDRLDLNQYTGGGGPRGSGGTIPPWSESAIDFAPLRAVDADLAFVVDALSAGGLRIGRSALDFDLRAGKLRAALKQMALYGGNGTGTITLNGAGATPDVGIDLALSGIRAEPLLTDAAGFNRLSGIGNITLKLAAAGRSQQAMMRSLDGTVQIKFEDGAIKGANLAEIARTIQSVLTGAATGAAAKTDFAELSGSLIVQNGVGRNEDLKLLNPFVRLSGAGVVDVGNQALNYRVEPRAVRSLEGQGGKSDLRGVGIPFKIKGPWSKLSYSPDLTGVTTGVIDSIVQGRDPLEDLKTQTGLDELFGKKKKPPVPQPETPQQGQPQPSQPAPQEPTPAPQPQSPPAEPQPQDAPAPPAAQDEQGVPPNPQQEGAAQPQKPAPKRKVQPEDVLKGLFGQ